MYRKQIPIWRDANQLLLEIEQVVRHFPRYHKYTLGSELRQQAQVLLPQLVIAVDDLKIQVQSAK